MTSPSSVHTDATESQPASQTAASADATSRGSSNGQIPITKLVLPWQRFYWAILDVNDAPQTARSLHSSAARAMLDDRFQSELPLPVDQIATAYATTVRNSVIACGLEIEVLRRELESHPALLTLVPDGLPPQLRDRFPEFQLEQLNLLVAAHEPVPIRKLRASKRRTLLAFTAASLVLVALGMLRRASIDRVQSSQLQTSLSDAVADVSGSKLDLDVGLQTLQHERDRLISTRTMQATRGLPMDASRTLAAVLAAWPTDLEIRAQSISSTSQGVAIAAEVNDQSGAETLSKALASVPDMSLQSPRTHASGKVVRFDASLQLKGGAR
ncbi:MAG: hypothetical protein KF691_03450 [Phycisphaeraceae bacterium]|nr:hypothetical protein [Phycisphaeraceae bacterium]